MNRAITISGPLPGLASGHATAWSTWRSSKKTTSRLQDLESAAARNLPPPLGLFHLGQAHYAAGNLEPDPRDRLSNRAVTAGLTPDKLHPLEQPSYKKIAAELDKK